MNSFLGVYSTFRTREPCVAQATAFVTRCSNFGSLGSDDLRFGGIYSERLKAQRVDTYGVSCWAPRRILFTLLPEYAP